MPLTGTPHKNWTVVAQAADGKPIAAPAATAIPVEGQHESAAAEAPEKGPLSEHEPRYYSGVAAFVVVLILAFAAFCRSKGLVSRAPSRRQTLLEQCVASINVFCRGAIGEGGEQFAPLVGTVFAFVLVSNLMGVLPAVFQKTHEGVTSLLPAPTANLSLTIAISLVVFIYSQYVGIRENGIVGYMKHFLGPIPALAPLMLPLELVGAIAKPVSLSIRLFGNVFGEETVIAVLVGMAATLLPWWLPIPLQFPMLCFGVFGSIIQAGVFTILTCAYLSLAMGDHDDHGNGNEHDDVYDELGAHTPATHQAHAH